MKKTLPKYKKGDLVSIPSGGEPCYVIVKFVVWDWEGSCWQYHVDGVKRTFYEKDINN